MRKACTTRNGCLAHVNSYCARRSDGNSAGDGFTCTPHIGEVESNLLDGDANELVLLGGGFDNTLREVRSAAKQARHINFVAMAAGLPGGVPVPYYSLFTRSSGDIMAMCNASLESQITSPFEPFRPMYPDLANVAVGQGFSVTGSPRRPKKLPR
jgi:hypothetical protein